MQPAISFVIIAIIIIVVFFGEEITTAGTDKPVSAEDKLSERCTRLKKASNVGRGHFRLVSRFCGF